VEGTPSSADASALAPGEWLINRDGHQFSRNGVSFHAPDVSDSGILARQREIETLQQQLETLQQQVESAQEMQATLEQELAAAEQALSQARATGTSLKQAQHELQMQHLRLAQDIERQHARRNQIQQELQDLRQQADAEQARQAAFEQKLVEQRQALEEARSLLQTLQASYAEAESALDTQRRHAAQVERETSEAGFAERECQTKIEEIERSVQSLGEQIEAAAQRLEELHIERDGLHDEGMREQLQAGLDLRVEREEVLSQARSHQEELASEVRAADEQRLGSEQKLQPLRDRLSDLRLKEQAARLNFEQYAMQLVEAKVDEAWLGEQLREGQRPAPLQADINRLTNAMNDLGAINMAAVEELATSTERKAFLDSQAGDLAQALETLDNAIRKIDRETRDMMQATFDTVNGHFNTLFPMLFGGGEAKLVMTARRTPRFICCPVAKRRSQPSPWCSPSSSSTRHRSVCWMRWMHRWMIRIPSASASWCARCRVRRSSCTSRTTRSPWRWPRS
jgi:chromosome segregation protein